MKAAIYRSPASVVCVRATGRCWMNPSLMLLAGLFSYLCVSGQEINPPDKPERFISYTNEIQPQIPMSIHVVKVEYAHPELQFYTTLGGGEVMGMDIVSEQVKSVPPALGLPLAAINGDFYDKSKDYPVRPRDVQIRLGEIVSHPTGHSSFWIDAQGQPQMTNVFSRFHVVWPDGNATPFTLNGPRSYDAAALYTAALGGSTHTKEGVEYTLEPAKTGDWLPLRPGHNYEARVRKVQTTGDNPLDHKTMVLSIGPDLISKMPTLAPGATIHILTETVPDLAGAEVAIGGGPALVVNGKPMEWKGWIHLRHPRTALGWNKKYIFLVEVDGRQLDVSEGMTFSELAEYMIKLGCETAMNLDGGGSATLWAFGAVRNSPSEGLERPAPNALVVVRKRSVAGAVK